MNGCQKESSGLIGERTLANQLNDAIVPDVRAAQRLGITLVENCHTSRRVQAVRLAFGKPRTWEPLCYHWAFKDEPGFRYLSRTDPIEEEAPVYAGWIPNERIIPELFPQYHPTGEPQNRDIVTYATPGGHVRHFGIVRDMQGETRYIESKWAGGGHVWLHPVITLPDSMWGEVVKYYSKR